MPKTTEELYQELLAQNKNYQQQADDILSQYDSRGAFSYDAQNDPLYQTLKDQYVRQGKRAMEDTMGQAAGLTGGYSSSYSQSAGNQAYNDYMTQLSAQIPALAREARSAYDAEGQRMLDRYNIALNAANQAYSQSRDALGDIRYDTEWQHTLDREAIADKRYDTEWAYQQSRDAEMDRRYNQEWEYQKYRDSVSDSRYAQEMAYQRERDAISDARYAQEYADSKAYKAWQQSMAEKEYAADQAYKKWQQGKSDAGDARDVAMQMISVGKMPSSSLLKQAGISTKDAKELVSYYASQIQNENDLFQSKFDPNSKSRTKNFKNVYQAVLMTAQTGNTSYANKALNQYSSSLSKDESKYISNMLDRISKNISK